LFWSGAIGFGLAASSHLQFAYVAAAIGHACANVDVVAINQIAAARLVDFAASCTTVLTRIRKMQVEACPRANRVSQPLSHHIAPQCAMPPIDTASAGHKIVSIERGSRKILLKSISACFAAPFAALLSRGGCANILRSDPLRLRSLDTSIINKRSHLAASGE
jgi:hypothetical protein